MVVGCTICAMRHDKEWIGTRSGRIFIPGSITSAWLVTGNACIGVDNRKIEKYALNFYRAEEDSRLPILAGNEMMKLKVGKYDLINERIKKMMNECTDRSSYYDVRCSGMFMEVLTYLNREIDRGKIAPEKQRYVEGLREYIRQHYREKITKDNLADVIRKSPNYAAALFSSITGQTIGEYVHSLRVKTAIYMLAESQLTVSEISEYLGYSDVSYFYKIFKRITGKVPSDYLSDRKS